MATILVPIPATDFDPTETAVPWQILAPLGHRLVFATPDGTPGDAHRLAAEFAKLLASSAPRS